MDEKSWQIIKETLLATLEKDKPERTAFLDEFCADNSALRVLLDIKKDGPKTARMVKNNSIAMEKRIGLYP